MVAYLLLVLLCLLFFVLMLLSNFDLMSPSSLMIIGYMIGTLSFLAMNAKWQIMYTWSSFFVELISVICFAVMAILCQTLFQKYSYNDISRGKKSSSSILVTQFSSLRFLSIIVIFVQLIVTFLIYSQLKQLSGASGISSIISTYRDNVVSSSDAAVRISSTLTMLQKITLSFSLMLIFYYFYFLFNDRQKGENILLVPTLFVFFQELLLGGRLQIFRIIILALFLYYLMYRFSTNWTITSMKKIVRIFIVVFLLSIPAFYLLKFLL